MTETLANLDKCAPFVRSVDPDMAEYIGLLNNDRTIKRMTRWLQKRGLKTGMEEPMRYKGRTYYTLNSHPLVRGKRRRKMALKKKLLQKQRDARIDPRTAHWFHREQSLQSSSCKKRNSA